jgi:formyltetrahydrofolate deformylase
MIGRRFVLTLGCPDRPGVVARIAGFLAEAGGSISEAAYHADQATGWFFTRQEVRADSLPFELAELRDRFAAIAAELDARAEWRVQDSSARKRVVILTSREPHCLYDLLGRVSSGELDVEVRAVLGNHAEPGRIAEAHGVPFRHVPFPPPDEDPSEAFDRLRGLTDPHRPHAIVLARFMRVLPPRLCVAWSGRAINIHHSFLPSFAGARPYHAAHARGVKLVGATCHYVTPELDAGPIIEQDVIRVSHTDTVADMVRKGRDIEKIVLSRGRRGHLEDRVLVHGNHTVVFP